MHAIKPTNKEFAWIISPYRDLVDKASVRTWLEAKVKTYNAKFVCVNDAEASFSLYEGLDFARTLAKTINHKNYIYLESRNEGVVFVHIKNGKVIEDRLVGLVSLFSTLEFIIQTSEESELNYQIGYFGLVSKDIDNNIFSLLKELSGGQGSFKELSVSHFESIEISDLTDDQLFYFIEYKNAVRDLADTKTQNLTFMVIVIVALIVWMFSVDIFNLEEKKERVVLVDDFKEYTQLLLNGDSFSARLAQDFRIHKLLVNELPNWKLYKVSHTKESIEYRLIPQSHMATLSVLALFADNYGMALLNDSNGVGVVASVDKQPVYKLESEIRRFPLEELTTNIIDIESNITPFATIRVKKTDDYNEWSSRELSIVFNGASNHELLRLAAIVDGYPERYPAFFSACQSQGCSYDVSPQGIISGAINFTIYGTSLRGNSNG
ncbi:MAG: hypothetical protein JJV99_06895 [Colwellia sp.]|nr:hypothetical protein [Colwellia sp.]